MLGTVYVSKNWELEPDVLEYRARLEATTMPVVGERYEARVRSTGQRISTSPVVEVKRLYWAQPVGTVGWFQIKTTYSYYAVLVTS